jgi:hypothetical protein
MRPWAYEVGCYPEHDIYEVEASRILKIYMLSLTPEYVDANRVLTETDLAIEQASYREDRPPDEQAAITQLWNTRDQTLRILRRTMDCCNLDIVPTCLRNMGKSVRFLEEPSV